MMLNRRGLLVLPCLALWPEHGAAASIARTYLIFFGYGSADLDARGRNAAVAAAEQYHRFEQGLYRQFGGDVSQLEVSGHTGPGEASSREGHLALGLARASKVAGALLDAGVPIYKMSVQSFGETRPMVYCDGNACGDAQNSRVEIVLR
jgi:outer membrane protein OmpA-like peptidoglycan-associated protein